MTTITAGFPANPDIFKAQAKRLRTALKPDLDIGHSQSLEIMAKVHGEVSWGRANSLFNIEANAGATSAPTASGEAGGVAAPSAPVLVVPARPSSAPAQGNELPSNHLEQRALTALWAALKTARPTQVSPKAKTFADKMLKDGLVSVQSFESYLDLLDVSLGGMVFEMKIDNLLKISKVSDVTRYKRPAERDKQATGWHGVTIAGFAAGLIYLEQLGFDTHPEVFIEPLLGHLKKARYLDQDELNCFWYRKERKTFSLSESFIDATLQADGMITESIKMQNGVSVTVHKQPEGLRLIHRLIMSR